MASWAAQSIQSTSSNLKTESHRLNTSLQLLTLNEITTFFDTIHKGFLYMDLLFCIPETKSVYYGLKHHDYKNSHMTSTHSTFLANSCLAFKWRLKWRLCLRGETGDVTSLTILPIKDSRVASHTVLDKSAIAIIKPKEWVNALTSHTTTVPAFQRIRACRSCDRAIWSYKNFRR